MGFYNIFQTLKKKLGNINYKFPISSINQERAMTNITARTPDAILDIPKRECQ
jgi:hypothetical protein